ncbi:MAG: DUF411 domain-containing protein [Rhodospirillaceae bacterium]
MLKTAALAFAALCTFAAPALAEQAAKPPMTVYKSPSCGCCGGWIDHMRAAGYQIEAKDTDAMNTVKELMGVPVDMASCHTATIDGYLIEGHVPADAVDKLLAERPKATGLAVPGMPIGSPGMEAANGQTEPYTAMLFNRDGTARPFVEYGQ